MGQKVTGSTRTYSLSQNFKKAQPLGNIPLLSSTGPSNFKVFIPCVYKMYSTFRQIFVPIHFVYKT